MLDLKHLRSDPEDFKHKLLRRDSTVDVDLLIALDRRARELKTVSENLKSEKNNLAKTIGEKKRLREDCHDELSHSQSLGESIAGLEEELLQVERQLSELMASLPNLPSDSVPDGADRDGNVCLFEYGTKPCFDFSSKNHVELNEKLGLFDFKRSAKTTGSGWPAYCNLGARLEWALINLMIDTHIARGYQFWMPPLLVKEHVMYECGQLPKFANQQYQVAEESHPLFLVPTAEAVLNGLYSNEVLPAAELPLRLCAYTPCFRRESGAAGAAERGLIRMHQFNKVEMFSFCRPEQGEEMLDEMVTGAELVLQKLNLHYKRMLLCTGDMSFAAAKTIDIEVWLPGQDRYYEVSSLSYCTDFQSRRGQVRYKGEDGHNHLVHTLNGSGLATSRLLVAILENNQQADGSVTIPEALRPYLGGISTIAAQ